MAERWGSATVGQIVATDYRAAAIFEQFGIDFCCGGRRLLTDACRAAAADPAAVIRALDALVPTTHNEDDVTQWPLERLIDHIVSTHHTFVRSALPTITRNLAKLVEGHKERHPELARVAAYFDRARGDLEQHLLKEEQLLFPYVRDLATRAETCGRSRSPFGTVENPIRMMEREHLELADGLRLIRELTNGYTAPADGGTTYEVCMLELAQFERDFHRHVHLENNILFPKAVELETSREDRER